MSLSIVTRFFLVTALFVSVGQYALAAERAKKIAANEKPVFAFFKLAKRQPDFNFWVEHSDKYLSAEDKTAAAKLKQRELDRLKWGFGNYNEHLEFLKVRTPIKLKMAEDETGRKIYFVLKTRSSDDIIFFPYAYGDQVIAIFPTDLKRFDGLPIAPANYERFDKVFDGAQSIDGVLTLQIRPTKADTAKPVKVDGVNFWTLSGDTAYFGYETPDLYGGYKTIMEYKAPWYVEEGQRYIDYFGADGVDEDAKPWNSRYQMD